MQIMRQRENHNKQSQKCEKQINDSFTQIKKGKASMENEDIRQAVTEETKDKQENPKHLECTVRCTVIWTLSYFAMEA